MKKLIILCYLISIGSMNSLYASPVNIAPKPGSLVSLFNKKKQQGIIKDHGRPTRGQPPKVRSGYTINKK